MQVKILEDHQIEKVHQKTLEILENTGVNVPHEEILTKFEGCGATVDHKSNLVKIPSRLVMELISKAGTWILSKNNLNLNPSFFLVIILRECALILHICC